MLFDNLPASKPAPRRTRNAPIFAVGSHTYVNWPQPAGQPPQAVPLTDGNGTLLGNDLSDGQEVEIMSWRPRSREGLVYQIRRLSDDSEWWIAAVYLRRCRQTQPVAPLTTPEETRRRAARQS